VTIRLVSRAFAENVMNPTEMHRVCERLIAYLETGGAATDPFTEDVFCDFTPPQWRIQAQGLQDVLAIRRRGHPEPGKVPRWTAQPTPEGFVMELEERWSDAKDDWYCREAIRQECSARSGACRSGAS
jgi:hypothetical protein